MSRKSEVYSWRVSRALKSSLEEAARSRGRTVAELLDEIVTRHLESLGRGDEADEEQGRLHRRAASLAGRLAGGDQYRAERSRDLVRARVRRGPRAH
jgi:predicted DNA-binding protein